MAYTVESAIKVAHAEIGYRESGSNDTKYNRWLGKIGGYPHDGYGYPWCCSFQSWVVHKAGGRPGVDAPKTAGCLAAVAWFREKSRWYLNPKVGDWVFYGPGGGTHVELVVGVTGSTITTIGGNTGGSLGGAYYNGDGVYKKVVSRSDSRIYGYGRPIYVKEDDISAEEVWKKDGIIPAPKSASKGNTHWTAASFMTNGYNKILVIEEKLNALLATVGKIAPGVDEKKIAAEVLKGLSAETIASAVVSALPRDLAHEVVSEINRRLAA